jgi:translation initiation factor IF-3
MIFISKKQSLLVNESITNKEVLVIDNDGKNIGVLPIQQALQLAHDKHLDLVQMNNQTNPSVCRIMNYGKYCFEQQKHEKESRKNQKVVTIKEIRMFSNIDTNDFNTKVNQAIKFLKSGNKVKAVVRFRKRAIAHPEIGKELLEKFKNSCSEFSVVDKPIQMEGRNYVMFLSSNIDK